MDVLGLLYYLFFFAGGLSEAIAFLDLPSMNTKYLERSQNGFIMSGLDIIFFYWSMD